MTSHDDLARVRALADSVIAKADTDPEYFARLEQDPITVLEEAGMDEGYAQIFATEYTLVDTVGHMKTDDKGYVPCQIVSSCFFTDLTIYLGRGACKSFWSLFKEP